MKAKTVGPLAVALLTLSALSACGASIEPARTVSKGGTLPTAEPAPVTKQPGTNERGNLAKDLGEEGGLCANRDCSKDWLTFTIDRIDIDVECTAPYAEPAENGQFVVLDVRVSTAPNMPLDLGWNLFNPNDFQIIGPDGVTSGGLATPATYSCVDETAMLPDTLGPGSKYRGKVVLDVAEPQGVVAYRPAVGGGWEWKLNS